MPVVRAHRNLVIEIAPAAAEKTLCLDPDGDVEDPMGSELANYVNCARRIHSLVRLRFDEIGLQGELSNWEPQEEASLSQFGWHAKGAKAIAGE